MVKKLLLVLAISCIFLSHFKVSAQFDQQQPEQKKCIKKYKSITDTYYGFPNLYALIFRGIATTSSSIGVHVSSIGPTGAKYEFMLTDNFGIGVDANYSNINVSYTDQKKDSSGTIKTYSYKLSSPAVRSMIGFNFHKVKEKIEFYSAIKIGYYYRSIKFTTDDPTFKVPSLSWPLPMAFRMEFGFRYFPVPFIGIHFNMGFLGGALFNAGVSSKF